MTDLDQQVWDEMAAEDMARENEWPFDTCLDIVVKKRTYKEAKHKIELTNFLARFDAKKKEIEARV